MTDLELATQVEEFAAAISKKDKYLGIDESGVFNHHVMLLTGKKTNQDSYYSPSTQYERSFSGVKPTNPEYWTTIKTKKQLSDTPHSGRGKNGLYTFDVEVAEFDGNSHKISFAKTYINALKELAGKNVIKIYSKSALGMAYFEIENTDYYGVIAPMRTY
jgi:hypothetical protein